MDKQDGRLMMDDMESKTKVAVKEVSGVWVLLVFVVLLGAVLIFATVTSAS